MSAFVLYLFHMTVYSDTFSLCHFAFKLKATPAVKLAFWLQVKYWTAWNYMVDSEKLRNFSKVFPSGPPCENWVRVHVFETTFVSVVRSWCDEWRCVTPNCEGESREGVVPMVWYVSFVCGVYPDPERYSLAWMFAEDVFMLDVFWVTVITCIIIIIISGRKEGPPNF